MGKRGECPNCGAAIVVRTLLLANRRRPYECSSCRSVLRMAPGSAVAVLGALLLVLGALLFALEAVVATPVVLFTVAVAGVLLSPLVLARISSFEAVVLPREGRS
jgi:uncharacterized protein (DUF983 family)